MTYYSDRQSPAQTGFGHGRRRRGLFARWWVWVLIGLLLQFVPWPASLVESVYTNGIHPLLSGLTARLHDAVPLSLAAALAMLFLIVLLLGLLSGRGGRRGAFGVLGWWLAFAALTFPLTFGLAYRAPTLESRLGLGGGDAAVSVSTEELVEAGAVIVGVLNEAALTWERLGAPVNADPVAAASRCLAGYLDRHGLPGGGSLPTVAKGIPDGALLRFGASGVIYPWLLEPHVDPALPQSGYLPVALHEFAHAAGYAREAEAQALALLAGLECGDPRVRYAAALGAAQAVRDALPATAVADYVGLWPASGEADAQANREVAQRYLWATGANLMRRVNDAYLISQGISDGVADYSRATTLLVWMLLMNDADDQSQP